MPPKFVSGGSLDAPVPRDDAWVKAQQDIEDRRSAKAAEQQQQNGKSLYEVLQDNKAKKQEAFEESIKLKNQFRSLDTDEIDFLDSVRETELAKDAAIRKETLEGLTVFRRQQEEADKAAGIKSAPDSQTEGHETWGVRGRKRKKEQEVGGFKGVKLRKNKTGPAQRVDNKTIVVSASSSPPTLVKDRSKASAKSVQAAESTNLDQNGSLPLSSPCPLAPTVKAAESKYLGLLSGYSSDEC